MAGCAGTGRSHILARTLDGERKLDTDCPEDTENSGSADAFDRQLRVVVTHESLRSKKWVAGRAKEPAPLLAGQIKAVDSRLPIADQLWRSISRAAAELDQRALRYGERWLVPVFRSSEFREIGAAGE